MINDGNLSGGRAEELGAIFSTCGAPAAIRMATTNSPSPMSACSSQTTTFPEDINLGSCIRRRGIRLQVNLARGKEVTRVGE